MKHIIRLEDFVNYTSKDVLASCATKRLTVVVNVEADTLEYEIESGGVMATITIAYKFEEAMKLYNELP